MGDKYDGPISFSFLIWANKEICKIYELQRFFRKQ